MLKSPRRPAAARHLLAKTRRALLEALEPRTLLSVTIVNSKTATFTDVDGDLVTVAVTKGTLTQANFITASSDLGQQLQELDLPAAFAGSNVTISVKQTGTGNGLTNVGYINATGNSLGAVSVAGDLGRINVGGAGKVGLASLNVFSLGRQGTSSQQTGGSLVSNITSLGTLLVTTDINQAFINVGAGIGSVKVGGSLIGGTAANSGSIQSTTGNIGNIFIGHDVSASTDVSAASANSSTAIGAIGGSIGNITIVGSVIGGAGRDSSEIFANGNIGKILIGGNITGSTGAFSAEIEANAIASITVNGSLTGGDGAGSGSFLPGTMGNVTIAGSVIGGNGSDSAAIFSSGDLGKVVVGQDLIGGSSNATSPSFTGYIEASGKIAGVFIGGSVVAGSTTAGGLLESGSIRAGITIASVQINGNLVGTTTQNAIIDAGSAIGAILIGGRVDHAQILAGYTTDPDTGALSAANGAAQIGKLTVDGDWIAGTVMAGTAVGADTLPGTSDDIPIAGAGSGKGAISSITIFGQVFGTAAAGDHFGFISSTIGSFTAAGIKAPLTKLKDSLLIGGTDDVTILEK